MEVDGHPFSFGTDHSRDQESVRRVREQGKKEEGERGERGEDEEQEGSEVDLDGADSTDASGGAGGGPLDPVRALQLLGELLGPESDLDNRLQSSAGISELADSILGSAQKSALTDAIGVDGSASGPEIADKLRQLKRALDDKSRQWREEMDRRRKADESSLKDLDDARARLLEVLEDEEREKERLRRLAELERQRSELEAKRRAQEREKAAKKEALQSRMRSMCPAGFDWHEVPGGWQCDGGSHFIYN